MADRTEATHSQELLPLATIQQRILVVRERHVMLDEDLAKLYKVETRRLIEQVKRNIDRFPSDFMFQLTKDEAAALRSQSAISSDGHGGRRFAPYVFTEQGVAMLSGVLRSKTAVAVNIAIMRAFVELRRAAGQAPSRLQIGRGG
jgi:ORF6N domain-containing protein